MTWSLEHFARDLWNLVHGSTETSGFLSMKHKVEAHPTCSHCPTRSVCVRRSLLVIHLMTSKHTYVFISFFPNHKISCGVFCLESNIIRVTLGYLPCQKDFRIRFLILWVVLGPENYKGFIAATMFAFAKLLPNFFLLVFFHVTPTFSLLEWWVHITF